MVDQNRFYFYKEKNHVDGGGIDEQVWTGEDGSLKPTRRCQKDNLCNYKFQSAAAVGGLLVRASVQQGRKQDEAGREKSRRRSAAG